MNNARRALLLATAAGVLLASAGTVGAATGSAYGARGGDPALEAVVGSSWTVETLEWPAAEPTRGQYDFSAFDAEVNAQPAGVVTQFRVHTCALTATGAPFWGTKPLPSGVTGRAKDPCTTEVPASQTDWSNFIYQLVLHYKNFPRPVRIFSINNEVNTAGQWPGVQGRTACSMTNCPVFADYITTLTTARNAAHKANPAAIILDAGLSSPTMGVALVRSKYEAGGKSDTALKAAVSLLNTYFSYRHAPGKAPAWEYIDPNQTISTMRSKFVAAFYGTSPTGDRPYYFATHLYGSGAMDAIQMHFYDYAPYIVNVLKFMRNHGGGTKAVYCWECGIMWPAKNSQLYNYNATQAVSLLQDKTRLGFANGMAQFIFLPMQWGSPIASTDQERSLPLICDEYNPAANAPGLCPSGSSGLSNVGAAFRKLATGQ